MQTDSVETDIFEQEEATFRRELPRLLAELAQYRDGPSFALVKGDAVDSTWDTWMDATRAGRRLFGDEIFMVKKIEAEETVLAGLLVGAPCLPGSP